MKLVRKMFWLLLLCCATTAMAQSFQKTTSGLKTTINAIDVELQFYNPSTIRVVKAPNGWNYTKESLSVIAKPETTKFTTTQKGDIVTLKSAAIEVTLDLKSGNIAFFDIKKIHY